ncbi:SusC/RagA family TonB-linked outer membrane protein [Carboxylicivirga caseinilyticus]|uniref:SusC/RagA family TonB-linked outer membrane protein n=1 Tax=Carboxylicivirga caseinilyticus TaxID=3417572 RepID=UPI003D34745C|nr:SusC/RagA family TonB-linked outer membrane protein [Marinilabiliaceae bacterium A049]
MKEKHLFMLILGVLLFTGFIQAQQRTITGVVTSSEDGSAIPGVSVLVKGTTIGTITGSDGAYVLNIPSDAQVVVYSFIGMSTQEHNVLGLDKLDIILVPDAIDVKEVVVTALGISREKKGLTYAVEKVSTDDMIKAKETNFVNNLTGKVAGVQVTQSNGSIGASSRVILRGWSSVTGNNEPLFVIDGIPIDNNNYSSAADGFSRGGIDYGNAAMDINPNDIEDISVLKGGTAAALYGSRAANGAIIITTKSGKDAKNKFGVSYNFAVSMSSPLVLPDYQNKYAQGYVNLGLGWAVDALGYAPDESWGPEMDGRMELHPITGEMVPLTPKPDNRKDFYDTGVIYTNNLAIVGKSDQFDYRFSWTNLDQKGIMPTSTFKKNQFSFNGSFKPNDRLKVSSSANLVLSDAHNRDPQGQYDYGGINMMFLWSGRNFDWREMRNLKDENGQYMGFYYSDWWDNPWFILEQNPNDDSRTRFFGNIETELKIAKGLSLIGRIGIDTYNDNRAEKFAFGGFSTDKERGGFINYFVDSEQITSDYFLSYSGKITEDIDINAILGHNINQRIFSDARIEAASLINNGLYSLDNATSVQTTDFKSIRRLYGVYASLNFGFKNFLFLDLTARNDWSSTLPKDNNSYFYPSAGLGFLFTNLLDIDPSILNHGKIRVNWAQVGNDAAPYRIQSVYERTDVHDPLSDNLKFPIGQVNGFSVEQSRKNPNLKPEMQTNFEIGTELYFVNNRIGLDLTYYNQTTKDQIIRHAVSASTGYSQNYINAGEIENKGVEVLLRLNPVKTDNFSWDIDFNYSRNRNKVLSLTEGVDAITLPGGFTSPSIQVRVGQPYGVIYGSYFEKDPDGNLIVNETDGLPVIQNNPRKIGDPNPDWMGSVRNTFKYKNLSLSVLFDTKQGGDLYSTSIAILRYSGQVAETETMFGYTREDEFVIPNSVNMIEDAQGNVSYVPNSTPTTINDYHWHNLFSVDDQFVFDASYIKLREVTLSYQLPVDLLKKTKFFQSGSVYASGRNLLLFGTNIPHIDPEVDAGATTGNLHGYEYANSPSTKSFTFGLNLEF